MTQYLIVGGFIAGVLLLVKYMMGRARADKIIATLDGVNDPKAKDEFEQDLKKAQQEVQDAKVKYSNKRRNLDEQLSNECGVCNQPSNVPDYSKGR